MTTGTAKPMALVGRNHPALHRKAEKAEAFDRAVEALAERMIATCIAKGGIALTAPQVGLPLQLVVTRDRAVVLNPRLTLSDELETAPERCLSIPGRWYAVPRAIGCTVTGLAVTGETDSFDQMGFNARMWQHEYDHLQGILICDRGTETRFRPGVDPVPGEEADTDDG